MPKPFRIALLAAATLSLGGCQTVFDLVGVAQPLSAQESRAYNGSYQGDIKQVSATGPGCPKETGEKVIMVGDGVLWYAYNPVTLFTSPVAYDGTIDASSGTAHMTGRVRGNHLDAVVKSPTCETRFSMDYILNHSRRAGEPGQPGTERSVSLAYSSTAKRSVIPAI